MTDVAIRDAAELPVRRFLPALLVLFVASGMCALIYEVVWFQLLELVIGATAVSIGMLLATFMGGMCLGALALPRLVARHHHPLRIYALLEAGIAAVAILVLLVVPMVGKVYTATLGHTFAGILLRGVICALCLLPPTVLMGATLPAVSRWIEVTPRGVSWMGLLYGANTVGAVLGGALAGFYLLRVFDTTVATLVAAAINVAIAGVAMAIARRTPGGVQEATKEPARVVRAPGSWVVYVAIALSGAAALGAEVVWTRLLTLMLGGTVYTFAMILAVFLTGLGLGSTAGAWLGRRVATPRLALGWLQALQVVGVAWAAFMIAVVLPYWPINPSLAPSIWLNMHLDLTRTLWVVLPGALLWGASFPVALAAVAERGEDPGRLVSGVYVANTLGAIIGSLSFSLLFIPTIGTQKAQQLLVFISAVSALLVFVSLVSPQAVPRLPANALVRSLPRAGAISAVTAAALSLFLLMKVPSIPGMLAAFGRYMVTWLGQVDLLYWGEGMNSSIAVTRLLGSGATQFHVAGKVQASSLPQDMRLQRMLGHLPGLFHPNPKSALVVGFGAGVTAGSLVVHPEIERLVICEIEPLVPRTSSRYFAHENHDVFNDRRVEMVYDDARSYVITTKEKFDIITSDPLDPWVKGAATLYTKEHFERIKNHLNPGGIVSVFVQLYETNLEAVKSEIATFFEVFPNGSVWANNINGRGYDLVLIGSVEPLRIDVHSIEERLSRPQYQPVVASMSEVGFGTLLDLLATFGMRASDLREWMADAEINRDRSLRLQYIAGEGLNRYESAAIYDSMAQYRKFPEEMFIADEAWKQQLRNAILGWR